MFGVVAKNANREYFQRTGRNGFRRLWRFRHSPANSGHFPTSLGHHFYGGEKKVEQTPEMVRAEAISNWRAVFAPPEIIDVYEDSRFVGGFPKNFYNPRYSCANSNPAPSSKFRGDGTSTRTFSDDH